MVYGMLIIGLFLFSLKSKMKQSEEKMQKMIQLNTYKTFFG